MTNQARSQVTQPRMVTKQPIKHYKTHTATEIHDETIPTVILARSHQDQPSPSKFGTIDQCQTSQFKFYINRGLDSARDMPTEG